MKPKHIYTKATFLLFFSAILMTHSFITASYVDPFETQKIYIAWVNGLNNLAYQHPSFLSEIYDISKISIKSPEIVAHIVGFFLSKIFGLYLLDVLKFLLLSGFVLSMDMNKKKFKSQAVILTFYFLLSFYMFTLNNVTYRLGIGAFFFVFSFYYAKNHSPLLSGTAIGLAVTTHVSLFMLLPLLFFTTHSASVNPLNYLYQGLISRFTFGFLAICFANLIFYMSMLDNEILVLFLGNKIAHADFITLPIFFGLVASGIAYLYLNKSRILNDVLLVIFTGFLFIAFGTSRTVMLVCLLVYVIVYFNTDLLKLVGSFKYKPGAITAYYFLVFVAYDLFKGLGFFLLS